MYTIIGNIDGDTVVFCRTTREELEETLRIVFDPEKSTFIDGVTSEIELGHQQFVVLKDGYFIHVGVEVSWRWTIGDI